MYSVILIPTESWALGRGRRELVHQFTWTQLLKHFIGTCIPSLLGLPVMQLYVSPNYSCQCVVVKLNIINNYFINKKYTLYNYSKYHNTCQAQYLCIPIAKRLAFVQKVFVNAIEVAISSMQSLTWDKKLAYNFRHWEQVANLAKISSSYYIVYHSYFANVCFIQNHWFCDKWMEDLVPLGWETSTKYTYIRVRKFEGEKSELGVGNPRAPHSPLSIGDIIIIFAMTLLSLWLMIWIDIDDNNYCQTWILTIIWLILVSWENIINSNNYYYRSCSHWYANVGCNVFRVFYTEWVSWGLPASDHNL